MDNICVSSYHSPSSEENESDGSGEDSDWEDVDEDPGPPEVDPIGTRLDLNTGKNYRSITDLDL